jgi:hypothetical protein
MELKEAFAQAQDRLAHLRQRRESALAELAQIDSELKEVADDEAVLARLVARYEGVTVPVQASDPAAPVREGNPQATDWRGLPRMQAVERALIEADEPLSPMRVHQVLLQHGRADAPRTVHAALGHLKIKHRATQSDRGLWVPLSKANGHTAEDTVEVVTSLS